MRLHCNSELTPETKPNSDIQDWVQKYEGTVPADIRSLANGFFNLETYFGLNLIGLCGQAKANSIPEFLSYLLAVPAEEIVARFLHSGVGPGREVTAVLVRELQLDQAAAVRFMQEEISFSPQEKWRALEYLLEPEAAKRSLLRLLNWHYQNVYRHDEGRVSSILRKANQSLRERLRFDEEYLRLLIPYDVKRPPKALTIVLSYYYEASSLYSVMDAIYLFGYRYGDSISSKHSISAASQVFKALGDETRLQILRLLIRRPWYGHELAQQLSLSHSTVSHHLSLLGLCGLIKAYKKENRVYYELDPGEAKQVVMSTLERILLD